MDLIGRGKTVERLTLKREPGSHAHFLSGTIAGAPAQRICNVTFHIRAVHATVHLRRQQASSPAALPIVSPQLGHNFVRCNIAHPRGSHLKHLIELVGRGRRSCGACGVQHHDTKRTKNCLSLTYHVSCNLLSSSAMTNLSFMVHSNYDIRQFSSNLHVSIPAVIML